MNHPTLLSAFKQDVIERLGAQLDQLTVERVVVGIFFSGVKLSNGCCGLAATPIKSMPDSVCCSSSLSALPSSGKLKGRPAIELLNELEHPKMMRSMLAIATLNALIETLWQRDGVPTSSTAQSGDAFELLDFQPSDHIVLVGAFPPYMRELRKRALDFKVLELDPTVFKPDEMAYYAPAHTAPEVVPKANVLITTATTLINGTLDDLLSYARKDAKVAVIGPTTPLLPAPFAQRGVSVIGGTRVNDADTLLDLLAEGASGYHFFEKSVDRISLFLKEALIKSASRMKDKAHGAQK